MKYLTAYCVSGLLALGSSSAFAQGPQPGTPGTPAGAPQESRTTTTETRNFVQEGAHLYAGANYGLVRARGDEFDDDDDFFELNFGGFFNPYVGVEANAAYFGEYGGDLGNVDVEGYGIALVGRLPIHETWGIYAKVGQFWWDSDVETPVGSFSTDGNDTFYGVGTDIPLTEHLNLIVEYNRFAIDTRLDDVPALENPDLDTFKVGLRLIF